MRQIKSGLPKPSQYGPVESRADRLRRQIAYYRGRLAEGADADFAVEYLRRIAEHEAELRQLDNDTDRRE